MLDSYITSSELYQEILRRGKQRIAQRALEGRFGALAEDVIAALAEADEATLEDLVAHVLRIVTGHEHCDTLRGLSAF